MKEIKDWNGNTIRPGDYVLYTQHETMRVGKVLSFTDDGKVMVEWIKARRGSLPSKPGKVNVKNLTIMGWVFCPVNGVGTI